MRRLPGCSMQCPAAPALAAAGVADVGSPGPARPSACPMPALAHPARSRRDPGRLLAAAVSVVGGNLAAGQPAAVLIAFGPLGDHVEVIGGEPHAEPFARTDLSSRHDDGGVGLLDDRVTAPEGSGRR